MSVDLIAAALIIAFAAIVVLGHVLVVTAIYKCLREDCAGDRGPRTTSRTTAADGAKRASGAIDVGEMLEQQDAGALGARGPLRSAGVPEAAPATPASRGSRFEDAELRTAAERT